MHDFAPFRGKFGTNLGPENHIYNMSSPSPPFRAKVISPHGEQICEVTTAA
jgi:hypothetical protein